jgi:hypothetical protein
MAKGRLFEYALLFHPKQSKEQAERNESPKSEILISPTTVLAATPEQVSILASRAIPPEYVDKLDDIEIVVRPF